MKPFAEVEALLAAGVGSVFPAAQLLVADGGVTVLRSTVGAASPHTRFDLASLTKPLCTAALVLRLVDRGLLSFDDRPRPECTVRQLLAHAGGLPGWRALVEAGTAPSREAYARGVEAARREPLEYAPGTRSIYSDLGYVLLGDAIERATGARLERRFAEEIAAPLDAEIEFGPLEGNVAPTEHGLFGRVHDDNARMMGGAAGHAGLFGHADACDLLVRAWVAAFHGEPSILPGALVRESFGPPAHPSSTWGLGWDHPSAEGSSAGERWPRTGVGHLAFTGCSIWIDPPRRRWVILLTNRVNPTRANEAIKAFRPQLHDAISAALDD